MGIQKEYIGKEIGIQKGKDWECWDVRNEKIGNAEMSNMKRWGF